MKLPAIPLPYMLAGGAVLAALLYVGAKGVKGAAQGAASAAVDLADGIVTGTVVGVGEAVGIPQTNQTACERAKAEGRTWDASFNCPAGDFLKYLWK
jgi:hypothetical protein